MLLSMTALGGERIHPFGEEATGFAQLFPPLHSQELQVLALKVLHRRKLFPCPCNSKLATAGFPFPPTCIDMHWGQELQSPWGQELDLGRLSSSPVPISCWLPPYSPYWGGGIVKHTETGAREAIPTLPPGPLGFKCPTTQLSNVLGWVPTILETRPRESLPASVHSPVSFQSCVYHPTGGHM